MSDRVDVPRITLTEGTADGPVEIPQFGLGTWKLRGQGAIDAIGEALRLGYRHLDSAEGYRNEREVGEAVRASGIDRSEVFVTSKLDNASHAPDRVRAAFASTLEALDLGWVDLFLIHWPLPEDETDYVETWQAMVGLLETGKVRAVGVSNFETAHLERIFAASEVRPAVNQIEAHPFLLRDALRAFGVSHGIATEAWAPLAGGRVATDPTIAGVAAELGVTPEQTALAWALKRGDIVFPKSSSPERMRANLAAVDVALTDAQLAAISALGEDRVPGSRPDTLNR